MAWAEWYQEQRKGEAVASGAGSKVRRMKRRMLVGDVLEYRGFYEGGVPIRFSNYNIFDVRNGRW